MVRRWTHIDAVDPERYVRRILYSRFVDGWRRRRLLELPTRQVPETPTAVDEATTTTDRISLAAILARLAPRQRAIIVLRFYADLSEDETAHAMNCSVGTVKSQTHHALDKLRDALGDPVFGDPADLRESAGLKENEHAH